MLLHPYMSVLGVIALPYFHIYVHIQVLLQERCEASGDSIGFLLGSGRYNDVKAWLWRKSKLQVVLHRRVRGGPFGWPMPHFLRGKYRLLVY